MAARKPAGRRPVPRSRPVPRPFRFELPFSNAACQQQIEYEIGDENQIGPNRVPHDWLHDPKSLLAKLGCDEVVDSDALENFFYVALGRHAFCQCATVAWDIRRIDRLLHRIGVEDNDWMVTGVTGENRPDHHGDLSVRKLWARRLYSSWLVESGVMVVAWDGQVVTAEHQVSFYDNIEYLGPDPTALVACSTIVLRRLTPLEQSASEARFFDQVYNPRYQKLGGNASVVARHPKARYFPVAVPLHEHAIHEPWLHLPDDDRSPPSATLDELLDEAAALLDGQPSAVAEVAASLAASWDGDLASLVETAKALASDQPGRSSK